MAGSVRRAGRLRLVWSAVLWSVEGGALKSEDSGAESGFNGGASFRFLSLANRSEDSSSDSLLRDLPGGERSAPLSRAYVRDHPSCLAGVIDDCSGAADGSGLGARGGGSLVGFAVGTPGVFLSCFPGAPFF